MRETDGWTLLVIVGMTVITVLTRCFFFISEREWRLPNWAQRGLQYAPIAALAAVIAPDLVLTDGASGQGYAAAEPDKLKLVGEPMAGEDFGFIFPKDSDLVAPVNAAIAEMKADGTFAACSQKWFVDYPRSQQ